MRKSLSIILFFFIVTGVRAQNAEADSLRHLLNGAQEDTNKVKILNKLCTIYQWDKPDSAIMFGLQSRRLAQQLHYTDGEIEIAFPLAEAFSSKGNFSQALDISLQGLQLAEKQERHDLLGYAYSNTGDVYFYAGDYRRALDYYLIAKQKEKDSSELIMGFIGETYFHLNLLDSALVYISRAYQMDMHGGFHWSVPYFYMASIQTKQGKYQEALDNYRKGMIYTRNASLDIAHGYNGISSVFKQMGHADSSIHYAREAIHLAQKESLIPVIMDAAGLLTELYLNRNIDSAFKYQRILINAKDSLFSSEKIKQLQNISFNEQLRQQELQQALQQNKLEYRNRLLVYSILAGFLILSIIALGLWRRSIYRKKSLLLLQGQKEQIEGTLTQLRSTQAQLIQSEKMASLGELTAGIAHEIQNPLNFVNNFSEVNRELLSEMHEELKKGNLEEVNTISHAIKENEEKISHHGKRAEAIVKGMLQHARTNTGQRENININALADEFLRLSYQGWRTKDNVFSAILETDFDQTIENINIIPQEIGLVFLNLCNNAFYAVSERKKLQPVGYEPKVSVRSQQVGDKIEIRIKDNGKGVSQKIRDKIFQPFFTTKPTGQGTGLGLSLSYDILKAHGGELTVESKEGEGAVFIVLLPVKG